MTVTLTEYPNLESLARVIKIPCVYESDKRALSVYLESALRNNGSVRVHYEQNYYNGTPYGRYYPKVANKMRTAQAQWRHVRSALFAETETDIDIVNCHPTLLKYICDKHGIKCKSLSQYVTDRDEFLEQNLSVEQDDVDRFNKSTVDTLDLHDFKKRIATASLYGCKDYKKNFLLKTNPWGSSAFPRELARITKSIIAIADYSQIVSDIRKDKGDAHDGTILSFILQEIEVNIVKQAMDMFQNAGFEITTLIHDGFQLRSTDNTAIDAILYKLSIDIPHCRFIRKPFKASIFDIESEIPVGSGGKQEGPIVCTDDEHAVDLFLEKYKNRITFCMDQWYIRPFGSYFWLAGDGPVKREISRMDIHRETPKAYVKYSANAPGCSKIFTTLTHRITELSDEQFITSLNKKNVGLVHFIDKHWDMVKKRWVINDPTSDTGCIIYIPELAPDWSDLSDNHPMFLTIRDKIFCMLSREQFDDFATILSRAMGGYFVDKFWAMLESSRDGGKSTMCNATERAFGPYVAIGIDPPFVCKHSGDASQNRWLLTRGLHLKRVAWCNERMSSVNGNGAAVQLPIDGEKMKKYSSGGDAIQVRAHFGNEMPLVVNAIFFMNFNGQPVVEPPNALKNALPISIVREFTDDEEKLKIGSTYMPQDSAVVSLIHTPEFRRVFQWVILSRNFVNKKLTSKDLVSLTDEVEDLKASVVSAEFIALRDGIIRSPGAARVSGDDLSALFEAYGVHWKRAKLARWLESQGIPNNRIGTDRYGAKDIILKFPRGFERDEGNGVDSCWLGGSP